MTNVAQKFLRSFKALPPPDQHDVPVNLLRLPIEAKYSAPCDEELICSANEVFLELEKAEKSS